MKTILTLLLAGLCHLPLLAEEIISADTITHALTPKRSLQNTKIERKQTFSENSYRTLNPGLNAKERGINVVANGDSQQASVNVDQSASLSFANIRFKLDSTDLADTHSENQLREIAKALSNFPNKSFVMEGHTCDRGETEYNQKLSERRALAIGQWFRAHGVTCELIPLGYGESDPKVENTTEENRSQNRRVVISLKI